MITAKEFSEAAKIIEKAENILVVPHANVDPDGISSALACFHIFQSSGKKVTVICPDSLPESLGFLPGFQNLSREVKGQQNFIITVNLDEQTEVDTLRYSVEDQKLNIIVMPKKGKIKKSDVIFNEGKPIYDLIVVVDSADLSLLGSVYNDNVGLFSSVPVLNIDHHVSNSGFGQMQLIDPVAASATEVLYQWFTQVPEFKERLTAEVATLLLTGLITDTRSFQNPNTTPKSLEVAAELLDMGAAQQEIIKNIYKTKPLSTLQIWGRALSRIQLDKEAKLAWSNVSREDLSEMNADSKETHGILDELISTIPEAEVYILFTELEEGGLKASLRSTAAVNVNDLAAKLYQGGGHARAAGFRLEKTNNFQLAVLECVQKIKNYLVADNQPAAVSDGKSVSPDGNLNESGKTKTGPAAEAVNEIPAQANVLNYSAGQKSLPEDVVTAVINQQGKDNKTGEVDVLHSLMQD